MKNKRPLAERDASIVKQYKNGDTMQVIANRHNISRQRVEQILRLAGIERGGKRKAKELTYKCLECKKKFTSYQKGRKFCSLKCSHQGRRVYKTKAEIAKHKEDLKKYYAEKSRDYYHNVFKKKKNWRKIVEQRNKAATKKRTRV